MTDQWQPIETAPPEENESFLVYIPREEEMEFDCIVQVSKYEGQIYPDQFQSVIDWNDRITTATHWMPRPKPPTEETHEPT